MLKSLAVRLGRVYKRVDRTTGRGPNRALPIEKFMSRCGLCLQDRVLKKSHLMPKSLHKVLRNASPESGKDLVFFSTKEGSSWYTDHQVKTPFLCGTCENLLSKEGEKTVCGECYRGNGKFILRDKVKKVSAILTEGGQRWINPIKETTDLNSDAYLYFGASVIWRASAGKCGLPP